MTQQTPGAARAVDPIMTAVARGWKQPGGFIAPMLFPSVPVAARAGKIIKFNADDFKLYNTLRSPGANTTRVQFGRGVGDFSLSDHSLEGALPVEIRDEAAAVPGIDESATIVRQVQNIMDLGREKEAADIARNAASYAASNKATLTSTARWEDPASDPFGDIADAREAIRVKTGFYPNLAVFPPKVIAALKRHPDIVGRLQYTNPNVPTVQLMQGLFEIPRIVDGTSIFLADSGSVTAPSFTEVWGTDVILAYVDITGLAGRGSPSYGYTYQLMNYPVVEPAYYGNNEKSWYYPVTDARRPYLTSADAGFLFTTAVS